MDGSENRMEGKEEEEKGAFMAEKKENAFCTFSLSGLGKTCVFFLLLSVCTAPGADFFFSRSSSS